MKNKLSQDEIAAQQYSSSGTATASPLVVDASPHDMGVTYDPYQQMKRIIREEVRQELIKGLVPKDTKGTDE